MRRFRFVLAFGSVWLCTSCGIVKYAAIDLTVFPTSVVGRWRNRVYSCESAKEAWKALMREEPGCQYSEDYADGFQRGYVDYLMRDGPGLPPVAPSNCYRLTKYESPQGRQAIADWFMGFQRGIAAAQQSGIRELIVVPLILPPPQAQRTASGPDMPVTTPSDTSPSLPMPRPTMSDDDSSASQAPAAPAAPPAAATTPTALPVAPRLGSPQDRLGVPFAPTTAVPSRS